MYTHGIYSNEHGIYRKLYCMYMYLLCISNVQIQIKYLYSTACLYNNSSDGVNLFSCSLSILAIEPPSNVHTMYICVYTMY